MRRLPQIAIQVTEGAMAGLAGLLMRYDRGALALCGADHALGALAGEEGEP
jgi:hypothetical protein